MIVAFVVVIHETVRRLVPKAMADAAGVQPLVVIFGLLIGAQLAGVVGVVLAIPMVVIVKEAAASLADYAVARRAVAGVSPPTCPRSSPRTRATRPRRRTGPQSPPPPGATKRRSSRRARADARGSARA